MPYDQWMTPPDVIEMVRTAMGSITYDPASNLVAQQYVKADTFCVHPDDMDMYGYGDCPPDNLLFDGLAQNWNGNVFLNPPYSAGNIDKFVDKALKEWDKVEITDTGVYRPVDQMIILVNSATDTRWYHKLLRQSTSVAFWRGRIKFWKIQDGQAFEKWEGTVSKEKGLGKIGNSPRYLNTLFYFGMHDGRFFNVFNRKATIHNKGIIWN